MTHRHPLEKATETGRGDEFRRAELARANEVSRDWSSEWNRGDFNENFQYEQKTNSLKSGI